MKILQKGLVAISFGVASFAASAASYDVDLFNGSQLVTDDTNGGGYVWATEYGPDATVLGDYRDMAVNCISNCLAGAFGSKMQVAGGILSFSNDAGNGVVGEGKVVWDGPGTNPGAGLSPFDLTQSGSFSSFKLVTNFSDAGAWKFDVYAEDASGDWSNIRLTATAVGAPSVTSYIPFSGFAACGFSDALVTVTCGGPGGGPVDLTDLDMLMVELNVTGVAAIDLSLDSITLVPEPSILALIGSGLLSLGLVGARRRKDAA